VDSRCQARLSLNHDELWARRAYLICHVLLSIYTYPICSPSDDHYLGYTKSSDVSGGIPFSLFGTISVSFPFLFRWGMISLLSQCLSRTSPSCPWEHVGIMSIANFGRLIILYITAYFLRFALQPTYLTNGSWMVVMAHALPSAGMDSPCVWSAYGTGLFRFRGPREKYFVVSRLCAQPLLHSTRGSVHASFSWGLFQSGTYIPACLTSRGAWTVCLIAV